MKRLFLTSLFLILLSCPAQAIELNGDTEFNQLSFYFNNGSTPTPQRVTDIFYDAGKNPLDDYYFNLGYTMADGNYTEIKLSTDPQEAPMSLGFYLSLEDNSLSLNYDGSSFTLYQKDEQFPDYNLATASIIARPNVIGDEPQVSLISAVINVYEGDLPNATDLTGLSFGPNLKPDTLDFDETTINLVFPYSEQGKGIYWSLNNGEYQLSPLFNVALNQDLIRFVSSDENILTFINKLGGFELKGPGVVEVSIVSNINDVSSLNAPEDQLKTVKVQYLEEHGQSDFIEVTTNPSELVLNYDPNLEENFLTTELLFTPLDAVDQQDIYVTTGDLSVASVNTWIEDNVIFSRIIANGPGTTELIVSYSFYNTNDEKIYTSVEFPITVNGINIKPTEIITNRDLIYLTTKSEYGYSTADISASLSPAGAQGEILWESLNPTVATVSSQSGNEIIVQAVSQGLAIIEATCYTNETDAIISFIVVNVNDGNIILDNIEINASSPDFYQLTAKNVRVNPAFYNQDQAPVSQVAMFTWSETGQEDMDCKVSNQIGNDWTYTFPVNNNPINNYYIHADKIIINIYGSNVAGSNGNFIGATTYKSVNPSSAGDSTTAYIAYAQGEGFIRPTVFSGEVAGTTGENLPLEGFRISSNVEGVEINTSVHVQDYGWQDPVSDGSYAGTMFEHKQIEAIQLTLSGIKQYDYQLSYRVHLKDLGWTDWVIPHWTDQSSVYAGTVGQNRPIEAVQVVLLPLS